MLAMTETSGRDQEHPAAEGDDHDDGDEEHRDEGSGAVAVERHR